MRTGRNAVLPQDNKPVASAEWSTPAVSKSGRPTSLPSPANATHAGSSFHGSSRPTRRVVNAFPCAAAPLCVGWTNPLWSLIVLSAQIELIKEKLGTLCTTKPMVYLGAGRSHPITVSGPAAGCCAGGWM